MSKSKGIRLARQSERPTTEMEQRIRDLHRDGKRRREIVSITGVSQHHVNDVIGPATKHDPMLSATPDPDSPIPNGHPLAEAIPQVRALPQTSQRKAVEIFKARGAQAAVEFFNGILGPAGRFENKAIKWSNGFIVNK